MARRTQTRGKCVYCQREMTRSGLARHLQSCSARGAIITEANKQANRGQSQTLYHLQVQDGGHFGCGDYWLHLEINGAATLADLDHYLREIWLECCYHLSDFQFMGRENWTFEGINMEMTLDELFALANEVSHTYDFGTSTHSDIKFVHVRRGVPMTEHPIALMGRNNMPDETCQVCDNQAMWLYREYMHTYIREGLLCDEHAKDSDHAYDEDSLFAYVNSPRVGQCGYMGPAEPPY